MPKDFIQLHPSVQMLQDKYKKQWAEESKCWLDIGAYQVIAQLINLQENDTHVDLGSGFGFLLMLLKELQSNSTIIGVDRSETMILDAAEIIRMQDQTPGMIYVSTDIVEHKESEKNLPTKRYDLAKEKFRQTFVKSQRDYIHLVCDDIRTGKALLHMIKGKKVDSGSFCFPGTGLDAILEPPFTRDEVRRDRKNDCHNVYLKYLSSLRKEAIKLMTKIIKPGGSLVLAERCTWHRGELMKEVDRSFLHHFGDLEKCWEKESQVGCKSDLNQTDNRWMVNGGEASEHDKSNAITVVRKYVRTNLSGKKKVKGKRGKKG